MKKKMTIVEARVMFGENCYETETGFLVNIFGKYCPNVTFVVGKEVELNADGEPINPLHYSNDREVTDSMNMDFDGEATFMFGDFWRSKKGGACFRPKNPKFAKDLLVRVSWGGCFNSHRGTYSDEANVIEGVKYFRRASSNGGGAGYDYWVVPVGFSRILHIDEVDGGTKTDHTAEFERRAKAYREKHAKLQREAREANDKAYRAKLAAEEASRQNKEALMPRLVEIQAELVELGKPQKFGKYGVGEISFGESYFKLEYNQYLSSEENLAKAEEQLVSMRRWVTGEEAKKQAAADAKEEFTPKFESLRSRVESLGWAMKPGSGYDDHYFVVDGNKYSYSTDGVKSLISHIEEGEKEAAEKRRQELKLEAEAKAKEQGLPSNVQIWNRSGATNAGQGYVIMPNGMDRPRDGITGDSRRIQRYDEGYEVWNQVMPGELVLEWRHAYTAAPHEFYVIYRPETVTEAQLERVAEIQNDIEERFFGKSGLTGARSCPSIGQGWGLFPRKEPAAANGEAAEVEQSADNGANEGACGRSGSEPFGTKLGDAFSGIFDAFR